MADAADLSRLALALPGVVDYPHFDRRAFKARATFATLAANERTANFKFAPDEQQLKCAVAPDAFAALPNAWGARLNLGAAQRPERGRARRRAANGLAAMHRPSRAGGSARRRSRAGFRV